MGIALAFGGRPSTPPPPPEPIPFPNRGTLYYQPPLTGYGQTRNDSWDAHLMALSMAWDNPGGWHKGPARGDWQYHPGILEIDFFELQGNRTQKVFGTYTYPFFQAGCIAFSELQEHYGNCPTSGVSELKGKISHGFGTWNAERIEKSKVYWAWIYLYPNADTWILRYTGDEFDYSLNWSSQEHNLTVNGVDWPPYTPVPGRPEGCTWRSDEKNIWCIQVRGDTKRKPGFLLDSIQETYTPRLLYGWQSSRPWKID